MWKIIKAELKYFRAPMILVWAIFILLSLFSPLIIRFEQFKPDGSEYLFGLTIWIVALHLIFVFARLAYEFRENRTRRHSQLPLSTNQVGLTRVILPFVFFLLSVLLILVCLAILTVVYPTPVSLDAFFEKLIPGRAEDISLHGIYVILPFGYWLAVTYVIRLLSEWQGRILLGTAIGLGMFYHWLLRLVSYKLVLILKDIYYTIVHVPSISHIFVILTLLVLMALLFIFFRTRRSFATA